MASIFAWIVAKAVLMSLTELEEAVTVPNKGVFNISFTWKWKEICFVTSRKNMLEKLKFSLPLNKLNIGFLTADMYKLD